MEFLELYVKQAYEALEKVGDIIKNSEVPDWEKRLCAGLVESHYQDLFSRILEIKKQNPEYNLDKYELQTQLGNTAVLFLKTAVKQNEFNPANFSWTEKDEKKLKAALDLILQDDLKEKKLALYEIIRHSFDEKEELKEDLKEKRDLSSIKFRAIVYGMKYIRENYLV